MLGTRWHLLGGCGSDLNRIHREIERVFDHLSGSDPRRFSRATYPALNLWEAEDQLQVEAELPGFALDELEIYVGDENELTIKGERKTPELENGTWHRQERGFGSFERSISLPHDVDPDKVTAALKNGVLTITLPMREEAKPRRIEVQGG